MIYNAAAMIAASETARQNRIREEEVHRERRNKQSRQLCVDVELSTKKDISETVQYTSSNRESGMNFHIEKLLNVACIALGVVGFISIFSMLIYLI